MPAWAAQFRARSHNDTGCPTNKSSLPDGGRHRHSVPAPAAQFGLTTCVCVGSTVSGAVAQRHRLPEQIDSVPAQVLVTDTSKRSGGIFDIVPITVAVADTVRGGPHQRSCHAACTFEAGRLMRVSADRCDQTTARSRRPLRVRPCRRAGRSCRGPARRGGVAPVTLTWAGGLAADHGRQAAAG